MGSTAEAHRTHEFQKKGALFKVSPYLVLPSKVGGFSLYLRQDDSFVLYAEKGELFTDAHKDRLTRMDVDHLYVRGEDYASYVAYLNNNLLDLLDDDAIPVTERARAWSDATISLAREAFDNSLPGTIDKRRFVIIRKLIDKSIKFLAREDALRELSRFINDGSEIYHHGVSVMVLTISVLATFIKNDPDLLVGVGMGALLHDIGKLELPEQLFTRRGESLSLAEKEMVRSHPALGVGICSSLPLPQESLHCILFHHEQEDGLGYPSGARGEMLPSYVKVLALCNEYDNLVRGMGDSKPVTPFEALTRIKNRRGAHELEQLKRLITILSRADLA